MASGLKTSSEVARIRRQPKGKPGSESAKNLLGSILDDSAAAAEKERKQLEENRRRAEEEELLRKANEEEMAKLEAEQAILAEQQAQEDLKLPPILEGEDDVHIALNVC